MRPVTFSFVVCVALTMAVAVPDGAAQSTSGAGLPSDLGVVDFPTSGPPDAQVHFLRGAAMLHSFGLEDAALEFRQAQALAPDFAMAHWGEAMSYNHPLQRFREWDLPRQALERLGPTREARVAKAPTEREKGFVRAVDALFFGAGEETDRRVAYADEMERLAAAYPDDHEVQAFYALALLATSSDYGYEPYRTNVKAGAIALQVFDENPDHPGAAHYIIHAFDDPIHAAIALPAATRFAAIAPGVVHALHMPSHIFIQLGMWDDVSSSNAASYAAALEMFERQDTYESDTQRYFNARNLTHALDWGQYGDLQRGDYAKAWQAVENGEMVIANTEAPIAMQRAASTRPRYVIETEQWQVIEVSPHAAAGDTWRTASAPCGPEIWRRAPRRPRRWPRWTVPSRRSRITRSRRSCTPRGATRTPRRPRWRRRSSGRSRGARRVGRRPRSSRRTSCMARSCSSWVDPRKPSNSSSARCGARRTGRSRSAGSPAPPWPPAIRAPRARSTRSSWRSGAGRRTRRPSRKRGSS